MNNRILIVIAFGMLTVFASCGHQQSDQWPIPSDKLTAKPVELQRYGKALFSLDTNNFLQELTVIQPKYRSFIGDGYKDSTQLMQLYDFVTDTQLIHLNHRTQEVYQDMSGYEGQLAEAFGRFHYFFPDLPLPTLYTYVSGMHYENPIEKYQNQMIIALDVYLGEDFEPYKYLGLPHYRIRRMTPDYLVVDVMKTLYNYDLNPKFRQKTLLDRMIGAGKMMVYLDAVLPDTPDTLKMGYTSAQWKWMEDNKQDVWAYLVKNNLFYSSDYDTQTKLIQEAPFTTGFSNESAPRVGVWLGWQIVRAYHREHSEISLKDLLLNPDTQEILQQSGYKP